MSRRFKNQKKQNEDNLEGITVKRTRNLSPNNPSGITERIIKYFENPKESKALAEIKRLSNKSKKSSKNIRSDLYNFGDSVLRDNTERNRVMFKEPANERAVRDANATFIRRKKQFATTRYEPRNKNMTLYDELKLREGNKNKNKSKIEKDDEDDDDDKFDLSHLNDKKDIDKNEVKEVKVVKDDVKEKKDFNANRFARYNIRNKYKRLFNKKNNTIDNSTSTSTDNAKPTSHHSNLRRSKKLNNENNTKRARFVENIKPIDNISNSIQEENNAMPSYNPSLTEDNKNIPTDENLKNEEKIVENENQNEEKEKNPLKNYKTEFVWDKNINRLVERRIYSNQNDNKRNKKNINFDNDKDNKINYKEEKNKPKKEEVKENYNKNKELDQKDEDKRENKKIESRKFGNKNLFPKNEDNIKKEENKPSNDNQFKGFRGYRFYRRYRKSNTDQENQKSQENQEEEKPKKEEIIIEKKTVTTIIEDVNGDYDRRQKKEKPKINEVKQNLNEVKPKINKEKPKLNEEKPKINEEKPKINEEKPKVIIKEKIIIKEEKPKVNEEKPKIRDEKPRQNKEKPEINEENKKNIKRPGHKIYKKRNFNLKLNDISNDIINEIRERSPELGHERYLTQVDYKTKYKKRPKYEPLDIKSNVIYTKKIKVEEKKPIQQKDEEKEGDPPYNQNKKKNIRINAMTENFDEEKDDKNLMKNNPYSNYVKGTIRPNKGVYRAGKTDSELYDDFDRSGGNPNNYLKTDYLKMYDNSHDDLNNYRNYTAANDYEIKMENSKKRKIPYVKRVIHLEDLQD